MSRTDAKAVDPHSDAIRMQSAIDALIAANAKLQDSLNEALGDAESKGQKIDELDGLVEELRGELDEYDERVIGFGQIKDLARARTLLKSDKLDEGRQALERVLDEIDSAWRTLA